MTEIYTKRLADCDVIYDGNANVQGLEQVVNIDDLQEENEHLFIVGLDKGLVSMDGIYQITDIMRGDRQVIEVTNLQKEKYEIRQSLLGLYYCAFKISKKENPEYWL
jgi:hypothetical protein